MTFEELQQANKIIKPTPLKGKDYAEVNQRIKAFRSLYPEGQIMTELVSNENGMCIFRAVISGDGKVLGTGTAYEVEGSTFINKSSYIENCETSAVGRALAMCGIGIDASVASFEEVGNAIKHQEEPKAKDDGKSKAKADAKLRTKVIKYINRHEFDDAKMKALCKAYNVERVQDMTGEQCEHYINLIESRGGKIDE